MGHTPQGDGQASDQASKRNAQGRRGGVGHIKSKTQKVRVISGHDTTADA